MVIEEFAQIIHNALSIKVRFTTSINCLKFKFFKYINDYNIRYVYK